MITPIIILALLAVPYLLLWPIPAMRSCPSLRGYIRLTTVFCFIGLGHFFKTDAMAQMIPASVPARAEIIYMTGIFEIGAGIAVLIPRVRQLTGWFLLLLLISFLPFNIYAAMNRIPMGGHAWGPVYLSIRVPLQLALIAWIYWFTIRARLS